MNLLIAEVTLNATVDKDVIKVTRRKVLKWSQHLRHHAIESSRCILQSLWHHQPLLYHTTRGTRRCERYVVRSHQNLAEVIDQIDGTEDDAS